MTIPDVFIIESLEFENEKDDFYPGKFLFQMLKFDGKNPLYYYIRTKAELEAVLKLFHKSNYRYLHICCHGNHDALYTTLDPLPPRELGNILNPYISQRRIFVSACQAVNHNLAKAIIPSSKCYSLIGPIEDIYFRRAAIIWAAFYHLMFEADRKKMTRRQMLNTLEPLVLMFDVPLNYFSMSRKSPKRYKLTKIN